MQRQQNQWEQVRDAMQKYGIDTVGYEASGILIVVKGEDLYKNPESPDLEVWRNEFKLTSQNFIAKNKRGVRVASDLSSYFISRGLTKQWFDLEYTPERKMSLPISILCVTITRIKNLCM